MLSYVFLYPLSEIVSDFVITEYNTDLKIPTNPLNIIACWIENEFLIICDIREEFGF